MRLDAEQLSRSDMGVVAWRRFMVENARRPLRAGDGDSPLQPPGSAARSIAE